MTTRTKKELLKIAYQRVMAVSMLQPKAPIRWIDEYVSETVSGFGTAADEKVKSRKDYHKLISDARNQSKGLALTAKFKTPYRPNMKGNDSAVFNDEMLVTIGTKKEKHTMVLYVSTVFQWQEDKWQLILFHSSAPNLESSSSDTFHMQEAEKKVKELEQKVAARTEELSQKNNELKIEAALERVRTVAMAMRVPEDMQDMCKEMAVQFDHLGFTHVKLVETVVIEEDKGVFLDYEYYPISKHKGFSVFKYKEYSLLEQFVQTMLANENSFWYGGKVEGKVLRDWIAYMRKVPAYVEPQLLKEKAVHYYFNSAGVAALGLVTFKELTEKQIEIFKRFRNVFNLAFKRYRDIEKAQQQAREAQIEAALERVRAKSLAMHHTTELQEVIHVVHTELLKLNLAIDGGSFIVINKDIHDRLRFWGAGGTADTSEEVLLPLYDKPFCSNLLNKIKGKPIFFTEEFTQQEKKDFFRFLFKHEPWSKLDAKRKKETLSTPGGYTRSCIVLKYTSLFIINHLGKKFSDNDNKILKRFGSVFEQSYIRFLDLQKAEAQAREAQIEAALERVRTNAMALRDSKELSSIITIIFKELQNLGLAVYETGIYLRKENSREFTVWGKSVTDDDFFTNYEFAFVDHYILNQVIKNLDSNIPYATFDLIGKEVKDYLDFYFSLEQFKTIPQKTRKQYYAVKKIFVAHAYFQHGFLEISGTDPLPIEMSAILKRFTQVIDLAYTRFLDLQKAEAQAREAQIEVALERVRSRTMAMHKSEELSETSTILFQELMKLDIQTTRSGFGIYDEHAQAIKLWLTALSTQSTEKNVLGSIPFTAHEAILENYKAWKENKLMNTQQFSGSDVKSYYQKIGKHLSLLPQKNYPPKLVFTVFFFSEGSLNVMSDEPLTEEKCKVMLRFAKVFDQTYTRFLDLQKAEAQALQAAQDLIAIKQAKQKAEEALAELQATQQQLIQSEKMASLGELTAGIAHEIQNPLNFVNNFSELNVELIEELKGIRSKVEGDRLQGIGNREQEEEILNDIKENSEKINHHGQRAAAIVKGMLQHSRTSSGQKEPTDINALCDEYLRLAYHGLRAKDKNFNAEFKTEFDESIPKVNIVPQDMGRVVLNLINNAFFAVSQIRDTSAAADEPRVVVRTKLNSNPANPQTRNISIEIEDNGTGIPNEIKEKIFQPFFTTKPTGQGTGLGLSLAYDIVTKVHGGKLSVESEQGKGTTFKIEIPV